MEKRKIVRGIILAVLLVCAVFLIYSIVTDPLGEHDIMLALAVYNIPITVDTRISVVPTFRTPSPFVSLFINTPLSNTFFLDTLFQM